MTDPRDIQGESPAERRARLRAEAAEAARAIGIDDALIAKLVHAFYDKVRQDALLGPVFATKVTDWDSHLARMCAFWASVVMSSGDYRGQPMPKHVVLPIDARHFDHWLSLFTQTATEICPPEAAVTFIERAGRIAQSLEMGLAGHHGQVLLRGKRFTRPDADVMLPAGNIESASPPCAADQAPQGYMWAEPTKK